MTPILIALAVAGLLGTAVASVVARRRGVALTRALRLIRRIRARPADTEREPLRTMAALPVLAARVGSEGTVEDLTDLARELFPTLERGAQVIEAFGQHELAAAVQASLGDGRPRRIEVRLFADALRTYRVTLEPMRGSHAPGLLLFLADVSEAVAYQELRSQFVANVSHELRTPLTGIRGLLEALADQEMDADTRARFALRAAGEAQRLEALIADVLFLSELESAGAPASEDRSDLAAAARESGADLADLSRRQRVGIVLDAPRPAWTPLSGQMARTVVRNLLENALKYAGPGATARASVTAGPEGVVLEVSDDGAGIPERALAHVFERFYRVDRSRSKELGGTGLGLSIVKHIVERYGGRVQARSRPGYGTTMLVELPRVEAPGPTGEAPDADGGALESPVRAVRGLPG